MADNDLRIKISLDADTSATSKVEKSVLNIGSAADKTSAALDAAKNALAAIGVALGVRELVQYADTWNLLEGRLRLVTSSTQNLATVQKELFDVAQRSRVGFEQTADLYTRIARSTETLGVSQKDLLSVTETISKTLAISGTSAESASAALMQLGQGFASGTLRGEELNSVLEQAPRLAEAIAKGMGKTVGELRQLGADGKLTAEAVFDAIQKQKKAIDQEFGQMPQTIGQSITTIENSFLSLVGSADDAINGSGGVTEILSYFSKAMDDNQAEIIEFGRDFMRVMQILGSVVVGAVTGILGGFNGIIGGFLWLIEKAFSKLESFINGAISMAESGINKIGGVFGKNFSMGRVDIGVDMGSQGYFDQAKKRADESANALKTIGALYGDIASMTTVIQATDPILGEGGSKSGNKNGKASKEAIAAAKKALEEQERIRRGYLEGWADLEAKSAIEQYNYEISLLEDQADREAKAAIEQYEIEKGYLEAYADLEAKAAIDEYERQTQLWDDLFSNINKSMESQFFDAMTGRFKSFGSWLKDFWASITNSLASGLSKTLADYMIAGGRSGLQNMISAPGLFGGGAAALAAGSSLSAADYASVVQQYGSVAGLTITPDGTTINSSGIITSMGGGGDLSFLLNNGGSLYSMLSNGAAGLLYAPSMYTGQLAGMTYGSGLTGTGMFLGGMSNGLAGGSVGPLTGGAAWGTMAGAGLAGGVGGYALGSLGDKLLGTDTKAGTYGAIGGTIGAIAGSVIPGLGTVIGGAVGSALGSVIGGMFGSKKLKGSGYYFDADTSSGDNAQSYADYQKKSWFKKKSWTEYGSLTDAQKSQISGMFDTYDYLLDQLGVASEVSIRAGKYTAEAFEAALAKSFISEYTGLSEKIVSKTATTIWGVVSTFSASASNPAFDKIYTAWADYAKAVDKSVAEAMATEIGNMIDSKRTFEEWAFGYRGDTMGLLQYQSSTAAEDLNRYMQSIGVSGVSIENYASAFSAAVRSDFTAETIQRWETLGDLMMRSADAAKALSDAQLRQSEEAARVAEEQAKAAEEAKRLADETKRMNEELARSRVKPADMMFSKVNDATRTASGETLSVQLLVEIVKTLKSIQTTNQFSTAGVLV